ncbi:hypothetical protein pb186bvf_014872 [Paramecium bursaria]
MKQSIFLFTLLQIKFQQQFRIYFLFLQCLLNFTQLYLFFIQCIQFYLKIFSIILMHQIYLDQSKQFWEFYENIEDDILYTGEFEVKEKNLLKDATLTLTKKHLYYSNKKKRVNIHNLYMEIVNEEKEQTLIISDSNGSFQIQGDITELFEKIKKYCIQTDFIHQYQMLLKLGQGQSSIVYKVRERKTNVVRAAKVFYKDNYDIKYINKEINFLRVFENRNIIQLHEVFETENNIILITDYCEGGSLQELINQNQLNEEQCKAIIKQIISAVEYLHSQDAFHRDLNVENIMLKEKNNINTVCLIDFGYADYWNFNGKYDQENVIRAGKTAPEIIKNKFYDLRSDVYQIGLILYQLITGKPPFNDKIFPELIIQNTRSDIDMDFIQISEEGKEFLRKLLEKNPQNRLTSYQALKIEYLDENLNQFKIRKSLLLRQASQINVKRNSSVCSNSSNDDQSPMSPSSCQKALTFRKNIKLSPLSVGRASSRVVIKKSRFITQNE